MKGDQISLINKKRVILHKAHEIFLRDRVELTGDDREDTIVQGVCQRKVIPQHLTIGDVNGFLILDGEGGTEGLEGG